MVIIERLPSSTHPQVVRVVASVEDPDFDLPWVRTPRESVGIGVVIGPRLLLTLASVVADAVAPTEPVRAGQALAQIKAIDHDRDLALLEVADSITGAWGIEPAPLGELPTVGDVLVLVGANEEATQVNIGTAVITSVALQRYAHSQRNLLAPAFDARQPIDVAGDAVFRSGKLIGLVMQRNSDDDQRGELIPTPLIRAFLDGVTAGKPPGVPALGISIQPLENLALRELVGLAPDQPGVLVSRVDLGGSCEGIVQPRDVLVAVDGLPVDAEGNVPYAGQQLRHYAVLGVKAHGDRVRLRLLRGGAPIEVDAMLGPWLPLVPRARHEVPPAYWVFAGLVFQPLTRDYLTTWASWWDTAPKELLHAYYSGQRTAERHELVVLTQVFEDPITAGYEKLFNESVVRVGDRVPRDLAELVGIVESTRGLVTLEMSSGGLITLDVDEVRRETPRLLEAHRIPRDRSPGL